METPDQKETIALIRLLDEPDAEVYHMLSDKITSLGNSVIPMLEAAWEKTLNPVIQHRLEEIIHLIQYNELKSALAAWGSQEQPDLLDGILLICLYQYPELDRAAITANIEQIKWDIWLELNDNLTALETIRVLNHVLFSTQRFGPDKQQANRLQHIFINNLLESKRGNPLSLGLLYLVLASKLDLPVYGIRLPEHFILCWLDDIHGSGRYSRTESAKVLFYINPFRKGTVFGAGEIDEYLFHLKLEASDEYYLPATVTEIVKTLITDLARTYREFKLDIKALEVEALSELF
ncbi:MAG TPA: transglutaminase family protein [Bacteroidales bacterium]|nr:transglutaminase family protein [Bacteroidales bacterium]HSA43541.1 transglutaminase family protein [Bacteroidales bacterium]